MERKSILLALCFLIVLTQSYLIRIEDDSNDVEWRSYQPADFWNYYEWIGQNSIFCRNKCLQGEICVVPKI
jgi:hypothetical protein